MERMAENQTVEWKEVWHDDYLKWIGRFFVLRAGHGMACRFQD